MKKNKIDLYLAAHAAAVTSLTLKTKLDITKLRTAAFDESGFGPENYEQFEKFFDERRETMASYQGMALPLPEKSETPATPTPSPAPQA